MTNFWCWFYKNYIHVFCIFLLVIVGGAFLAPLCAHQGATGLADILYAVYRISCHQLAYRSWFLFGEQPFYPLRIANIHGLQTYEGIMNRTFLDPQTASRFTGNEQIGYKVALCQRDIAIYLGFILAGAGFELFKRKWQPIPVLYWIILGILPMLVDGVLQWGNGSILEWRIITVWESTPWLRTATGFFFGFTCGWFVFPKLEVSLRITRDNHNCKEK